MIEPFLNGKVTLHAGDCLDVLARLEPCSIDSVVTDPPYHLTSIVKRFGGENAVPAQFGNDGRYARASSGFMGRKWDGGDVAFRPETWAAVYRVLKPGGYLLAFGGTRTYHRMACAIEDAGFEIRDCISWLYGSGFPKSHDVSKGIDRHGGKQVGWFGPWLKAWREANGIKQSDVAALFPSKTGGKTGCVANWELGFNLPTPEQFNAICQRFGLPFETLEAAEREIVGRSNNGIAPNWVASGDAGFGSSFNVTAPATDAAREWAGWGTALKPALEPICMARKPLGEGTVAANVLRWGTGALNVDGCRVEIDEDERAVIDNRSGADDGLRDGIYQDGIGARAVGQKFKSHTTGRWPANVVHDGSDEVVAAFPETHAAGTCSQRDDRSPFSAGTLPLQSRVIPNDSGSAARFFYTAKADADDRLGSRHPTVKPLDLMQYLVRLVTPKGGTVLDPFAGTGTTGEAAWREGMRAVLIEAEPEYQTDIRRRMALALAGPDERVRESIKARGEPIDYGPLFAALREAAE